VVAQWEVEAGFGGAVRLLGPLFWVYWPRRPSPRPPPEAGALGSFLYQYAHIGV
jgi:hypothetical protein